MEVTENLGGHVVENACTFLSDFHLACDLTAKARLMLLVGCSVELVACADGIALCKHTHSFDSRLRSVLGA